MWGLLPGALPGLRVGSVVGTESELAGIMEQMASQLARGSRGREVFQVGTLANGLPVVCQSGPQCEACSSAILSCAPLQAHLKPP